MLISVCQGTFADAVRLSSRCNTNCKLHTDEGDGCFFGFAFEGFCAFVLRGCNVIATRCKVFAFSFVRCYCLRVGALVCAFALFFGCLFAVCAAFYAFAILCPPCALSRVYVACIAAAFGLQITVFLCAPSSEIQRPGGAKMGGGQGDKPPPPPWVRFIVCGVLPRPAAVFPLLNNCGRRRGQ